MILDNLYYALTTWIKRDRKAWIYCFVYSFVYSFYFSVFLQLSIVASLFYFLSMYTLFAFSLYSDDSFDYLCKDNRKENLEYEILGKN